MSEPIMGRAVPSSVPGEKKAVDWSKAVVGSVNDELAGLRKELRALLAVRDAAEEYREAERDRKRASCLLGDKGSLEPNERRVGVARKALDAALREAKEVTG